MTEPMPERTPSEQAYADYISRRPHPEDEWVRIVGDTYGRGLDEHITALAEDIHFDPVAAAEAIVKEAAR